MEQAIELAKAMQENHELTLLAPDYVDSNVSVKVVKIIQSFFRRLLMPLFGGRSRIT